MVPYDLTPAAEADLRDIVRYTLRQWGARQAQRYVRLLEAGLRMIAEGRAVSRTFSERYPQVWVTRCEHHYICRRSRLVRAHLEAKIVSFLLSGTKSRICLRK